MSCNRFHLVFVFAAIICNALMPNQAKSNQQQAEAVQWQEIPNPEILPPGFTRLPSKDPGVQFINSLDQTKSLMNQVFLNGSGVALGDVNGDGLCDIYLCGLDTPNHLYLNQGEWKFREVAKMYGVDCAGTDSTGAALADLDGDEDLDLIVNAVNHKTRLFENDGTGFTEVTSRSSSSNTPGGTSVALADVNGDGLLDYYVAHYRDSTLMDMPNTHFKFRSAGGRRQISIVNGVPVEGTRYENRFRVNSKGGIEENGLPDFLYLNQGQFRFTEVPISGERFRDRQGKPLTKPLYEWGLAVMFRDINEDGRPDLYVCNDFDSIDRFWLNVGDGFFREAPAFALRNTSMFSMGVDFADVDRDGLDDFFVLDMRNRDRAKRQNQMLPRESFQPIPGNVFDRPQYMRNTFYFNRGAGVFSEIGQFAGVAASDWSWCPVFLDVDLDGFEDLLITNGVERNARHLDTLLALKKQRESKTMTNREILLARKIFPSQRTANVAFRNTGNLTFAEVSDKWGFGDEDISHGMACGDLDGDGDLDLVVNNLRAPAGIYRNNASHPRLAVRLRGPSGNTHGIGARITVDHGDFSQSQEMIGGGRYLSSDEPLRTFAMAKGTAKLTVNWPDGKRSVVETVQPNRIYLIDHRHAKDGEIEPSDQSRLFREVRMPNGFRHQESVAPSSQPLLPRALGQAGPGVAVGDWNKDGWEDLVVSNGKGGATAYYRNNGGVSFEFIKPKSTSRNIRDGMAAIINNGVVIQSYSNQEDGLAFGDMIALGQAGNDPTQKIAAKKSSAGHLAMADVDGDGDLDLFVAGRSVPNQYPSPADSWVYLNENGTFNYSSSWSKAFESVGLVSSAVFAPIADDGRPDLILACEWGSPKVFINSGEGYEDRTESFGLDTFTGFWNGVDVGDFNGDGQFDFIVTNHGLNSSSRPAADQPVAMFHGDVNQDGIWDIVETEYDDDGALYPRRHLASLSGAMPWLTSRLRNYEHYSRTPVVKLFSEPEMEQLQKLEVTTLESMVFIRKNDRFEASRLPKEAQFTTAFSPVIADFNNDGFEDIALSQNEFGVHREESRQDAGYGLILLGDGKGQFRPMSFIESGFVVPGEGRGAAVGDINHDGKTDIIVTQNGGIPKLFLNRTKSNGLRVTLHAGERNPKAIGASVRIKYGESLGPSRLVRLGSGYLSQNAPTQVFARQQKAEGIIVAWPSGNESEFFKMKPGQDNLEVIKGRGIAWPITPAR